MLMLRCRAIQSLNLTMITLLREACHQTGLVGSIIMAGPDPYNGGNISLFECVSFSFLIASQLTTNDEVSYWQVRRRQYLRV